MAALSLDVVEVALVALSPMDEEHGGNWALMMLVLEFEMTGFKDTVRIVHVLVAPSCSCQIPRTSLESSQLRKTSLHSLSASCSALTEHNQSPS
jgi:hypothetical protein